MGRNAKKTEHAGSKKGCGSYQSIKLGILPDHTTAYCPHCRTVTNLRVTSIPQIVARAEGSTETAILKIYHCESCRLFVRSEEEEDWV